MLRRELKHLGGRSHHETLSPTRGANHGRIDCGDGTHVRIGRNTDEGRLDTVWETVVLPPGPRAVDWRRDVAHGARGRLDDARRRPTGDKDENNQEGQHDNDRLHILLYKHNFS